MPTAKRSKKATPKSKSKKLPPLRPVVPDKLDLRDRIFMPTVDYRPAPRLEPKFRLPVLNQGQTNACTGFALASVVNYLQCADNRTFDDKYRVSPFMLYSMARRYDEFPGDPAKDTGSSLRGAMKGWYKHGVCREILWEKEPMPIVEQGKVKPADDWWLDAVQRPLGAYYRVDTRSVTDMHVAITEVRILYASAICHSGWDSGFDTGRKKTAGYWTIPPQKAGLNDGGHAFVIVGYDEQGFIIQNSWGKEWGAAGFARLTYEDWIDHAMDCWVAQMGVVTEQAIEIAGATSLRTKDKKIQLANDVTLRNREIDPFIIDMENNGKLSNTGEFRTQKDDVEALVTHHLNTAIKTWQLRPGDPVDIAIYAHGGLTSEDTAAKTAATWIKALYDAQIFPIFFMWETDLWSTLKDRLHDLIAGTPRPTAGIFDTIKDIWNRRLERLLSVPGSLIWGEMKQNAAAITVSANGDAGLPGGILLYDAFQQSDVVKQNRPYRLHLIGHSAGAIVHSYLIHRLFEVSQGRQAFETVNFMAPAVRVDVFEKLVDPVFRSRKINRYNQFELADKFELDDPTCRPILGYDNSLLYLVSQSFEGEKKVPILGMEKYFTKVMADGELPRSRVKVFTSPGPDSQSTTHGGFDDDPTTMNSIINLIKASGKKQRASGRR